MIQRVFDKALSKALKQYPAVCLLGARQSGKTTAAQIFAKQSGKKYIYLDLESPFDARRLTEPELFLSDYHDHLVVIDEVQRMPELFSLLRALIDKNRKAGRFLLLGSANPALVKGVSETLAGRIGFIDVHPFNLLEILHTPKAGKHWLRGGFPDALMQSNDSKSFNWLDNFTRTFIERDLNQLFGVQFSPVLMQKIWRMLAHANGQLWNAQSFAKGLDVSPTTINRYLDYLEGAYMVRKLAPYHTNTRSRLLKTHKAYFRDSGLLHYLLELHDTKTLNYSNYVGFSWEGYVIEQILQLLPRNIMPYFYRTQDGAEMDLVLVKGIKAFVCIEIKLSLSPSLGKSFINSISALNTAHNYIITPGAAPAYSIQKHIKICSLQAFLQKEIPKLI